MKKYSILSLLLTFAFSLSLIGMETESILTEDETIMSLYEKVNEYIKKRNEIEEMIVKTEELILNSATTAAQKRELIQSKIKLQSALAYKDDQINQARRTKVRIGRSKQKDEDCIIQ